MNEIVILGGCRKSKILHGVKREIVVSYGQSISVDAAAVEEFRLALVKAKKPRLLKTVFEKTIRWTLQSPASKVVRGSKLSDTGWWPRRAVLDHEGEHASRAGAREK